MSADHPTDLRAHALCAAHRTLARLVAAGIEPQQRVVEKAIDRASGHHVVVIITRWQPMKGEVAAPSSPTGIRDVEEAALEAAPAHDSRPVSVRRLAKLAGYGDNGHFREAVNQLLERGLLTRIRGGVRRAKPLQ